MKSLNLKAANIISADTVCFDCKKDLCDTLNINLPKQVKKTDCTYSID